jgi:glucose/arabinose dehydrogenase/cytochrome c551/c552
MNSNIYFLIATSVLLLPGAGFGEESAPALTYLNWKANPDAGKTPRNTGSTNHPDAPDAKHFKVEILSPELFEPMEFCMLPTGTILICERKGALREYNFSTRETRLVATLPVAHKQGDYASECGFLGLIPDPDFLNNNYLYIYYSVISKSPSNKNKAIHRSEDEVHRLSRFVYKEGDLKMDSEVVILEVPTDRKNTTCHEAGSMAFGPDGLLFLATGDNTNPFWKDASPMNPDSREQDARRSSGNTNDLRGAILRIKINPDGSYSIPKGNLFKPGTPKTRPEIYAMGLRNPYRISVNQKTGTLYWSEVSPDKNPTGEEINQAKQAGFFGWPYFIGDNLRFITPDNILTDPKKVVNSSPFNTGLPEIPLEPVPPLLHYNRSCAIIGGIYHYDKNASKFSLPPHYDNCLFFGDWNRSWIQLIRLDKNENKVAVENFPINFKFRKVIDFFFHDGELYVLEFGNGWFNTKGGRMCKISYSPEFNQQANPESDQRISGMDLKSKGTTLIQNATCLSCHTAQDKIIGPSFVEMAAKYKPDEETIELLAGKVKTGGGGVWGPIPMPAHPQYNDKDIREMINAMLATKSLSAGHKQ